MYPLDVRYNLEKLMQKSTKTYVTILFSSTNSAKLANADHVITMYIDMNKIEKIHLERIISEYIKGKLNDIKS